MLPPTIGDTLFVITITLAVISCAIQLNALLDRIRSYRLTISMHRSRVQVSLARMYVRTMSARVIGVTVLGVAIVVHQLFGENDPVDTALVGFMGLLFIGSIVVTLLDQHERRVLRKTEAR